jgi:hypothetical protein
LLLAPSARPWQQALQRQKVASFFGAFTDKRAFTNTTASLANRQRGDFIKEELLEFRPFFFSSNEQSHVICVPRFGGFISGTKRRDFVRFISNRFR